ncbi:MAG TPA: hypothetical protein VGF06_14080 [Terriglobales bacterium]
MKSILLIEESTLLRMTSEHALTAAGYRVLGIRDAGLGICVARHEAPDLILLDRISHGREDELIRALKQDPATERVPVVVLSGEKEAGTDCAVAYLDEWDRELSTYPEAVVSAVQRVFGRRVAVAEA